MSVPAAASSMSEPSAIAADEKAGRVTALASALARAQRGELARANQARAQLLQALSIASDNINVVRAAVAREENSNS